MVEKLLSASVATSFCPAQCRAARGLLDWTQERLAEEAGVSRSTVRDFECGRHGLQSGTADQIVAALAGGGAVLLPPDGRGPGVRLASDAQAGTRPPSSSST